jgi:hypothetical protein
MSVEEFVREGAPADQVVAGPRNQEPPQAPAAPEQEARPAEPPDPTDLLPHELPPGRRVEQERTADDEPQAEDKPQAEEKPPADDESPAEPELWNLPSWIPKRLRKPLMTALETGKGFPQAFLDTDSVYDLLQYARKAQITTDPDGGLLRKGAIAWAYVAVVIAVICDTVKWTHARFLRAVIAWVVWLAVAPFLNSIVVVSLLVPDWMDVTWVWGQFFG